MRVPEKTVASAALVLACALALPVSLPGAGPRRQPNSALTAPVVSMDGGRRLQFVRAFSSEKELNPNRSFWKRALDFVAGPPDYGRLIRPSTVPPFG